MREVASRPIYKLFVTISLVTIMLLCSVRAADVPDVWSINSRTHNLLSPIFGSVMRWHPLRHAQVHVGLSVRLRLSAVSAVRTRPRVGGRSRLSLNHAFGVPREIWGESERELSTAEVGPDPNSRIDRGCHRCCSLRSGTGSASRRMGACRQ